jgi:hypothetical protein
MDGVIRLMSSNSTRRVLDDAARALHRRKGAGACSCQVDTAKATRARLETIGAGQGPGRDGTRPMPWC